ncbi:VOC family protein [Tenggerimyces flavus]|uniref:VOC family protein n=1 Tax=Tenggerimyces flavus TaxID=1708749 RepID=A0ABV7YLR7_9ACTN|nr:VOC family protein [Tenggerimyces flavus]MBM7787243.1 hypothetical protein [Tenggerimyces flavus]
MGRELQIVIDAHDPVRLAEFWATALGYVVEPAPRGFESWREFARVNDIPKDRWAVGLIDPDGRGPRVFLPTVTDTKRGKNRVHLDIFVGGGREQIAVEVARLVGIGATHVADRAERGTSWTVLQDPEGNEFCVQ